METSLSQRIGARALTEIRDIFALSEDELAGLFGVSRRAVANWRQGGVPAKRAAEVDRVRELAAYFWRRFMTARVPQIVRSPVKSLGGKNVLELIANRDVDRVYAYLEDLSSYTSS